MAFFLALLVAGQAWTNEDDRPKLDDKRPVRARLVANVATAGPGEEFQVGVLLDMAPGWHVYWAYPGNTGKPTRVKFITDRRYTRVLEPTFPRPEIFDAAQIEDLSFGYKGSVLIPANAMVIDRPPAGKTLISAEVSWLACKEACVTGGARPQLALPVSDKSRPSKLKERFERIGRRLPERLGADQAWLESLVYEKGHFRLRVVMPGLRSAEGYVPRWIPGSTCKIDEYRIVKDARGRAVAELRLHGDNCLPEAGGVVMGRLKDAAAESSPRPYALSAWAPEDERPSPAAGPPPDSTAAQATTGVESKSLWLMLLFAFLGGLLLNIMPCVIPVVVPKLMHVVRTAQKTEDPAERRRLLWSNSLAYAGGVVATLMALGALVVALKLIGHEVGWGFQFQNPWFLVFMISLLIVLGLGMLHVYPLQSAGHVDDLKKLRKTRRRSPLLESFLTGLLVTFLGTPCTAPLLGPALGYAFSASTAQILLFMFTVGLGLSSPFLLLGAWTGWTRVLPTRVTERYDRVMRGMAFLLFGTAVWLTGVLADGYGSQAAMNVLWFELVLATGAWVFGLVTAESDPWRRRLLKLLPVGVLVGAFGWWMLGFQAGAHDKPHRLQSPVGIQWQPFDEAEVAEMRKAGKTVFLDFTAEWCMNCKVNERLVIETSRTKRLLDELQVVAIKADHTRFDPVIQTWLKRWGRAGVPMYLVFPACAPDDRAALLPEILTPSRLHRALREAGPSKDSCP